MDHIFFDLDGTLTDPAPGITGCIRYAVEELGFTPEENLNKYIGPPLRESFRCMLATMDGELVEEAMRLYRERFARVGLFENALYEGIPDLLAELREGGSELRVVTSKPKVYADRIIDHFELREWFPFVYGAELDGARSDKGELIAWVLEQEGLTAGAAACMIGDRRHDILGAKKHRLATVGVAWGYGAEGELVDAGADRVVEHVPEVAGAIRELTTAQEQ